MKNIFLLMRTLLGVGLLSLFFAASVVFAQTEVSDPIEDVNRGVFWFNDQVDIFFLEPVAEGYDSVIPESVQNRVGNFFENLNYPKYLVSDLVQLKFTQVASHTGRFLVNTILGLGGIFDVATDWGLPKEEEDFGIALAYHDIPPGPYLVLPFLGPSNLRDGVGRAVDYFLNPFTIFSNSGTSRAGVKDKITISARALDIIDTRAGLLDAVEAAKESSVDYYLFMQSAYYQYRRGVLYDGNPPEEELFDPPETPE